MSADDMTTDTPAPDKKTPREPPPQKPGPKLRSGKGPKQPQLPAGPGFTVITGLAGAGRTEASRCLEDLGYFVVDNLPPALIPKMAELASGPGGPKRVAFVVDARGGAFFLELATALEDLQHAGIPYRILYLEASEDQIVNRFEATRRKHPLSSGDRVVEGIRAERPMMEPLRAVADYIIDTTDLTPHELRERVRETFSDAPPEEGLQVTLLSFGFKYGAPRDADLVFDVRFLPNPYWIDSLRSLPGTDDRVRSFVKGAKGYREFMRRLRSLLEFTLPGYVSEGKHYLTIAVGCTGGRHRSVVVTEDLSAFFRGRHLPITVEHRDVERVGGQAR